MGVRLDRAACEPLSAWDPWCGHRGCARGTRNIDQQRGSRYLIDLRWNRELIDDETDRAFFVRDGVEKTVIGGPEVGEPPVHPDHEERGTRQIPVDGRVRIEADDVPQNGKRVWLKGYGCVRHTHDAFEFTGDGIEAIREEDVPVVHWVSVDSSIPLTLRTMESDVEGYAELGVTNYEPDDLLQFERVGFARIDSMEEERAVAYFAHQ